MLMFYRFVLYPVLLILFRLLSLTNTKVRRGWQMRTEALPPHRAKGGVWIHCASGEFEYAKPVIKELKLRHPRLSIGVTYFSPSVAQSAAEFEGVDEALPSPWDTPRHVKEFLDNAQPKVLLIARTDLWPELLHQCRARGIPTVLFSATLTESSGRMSFIAQWFYRWVTAQLTWVSFVSEDDQRAFEKLVPGLEGRVLGDTRFDQVLARLHHPKPLREELKPCYEETLTAGSTWPEDEVILLESFAQILARNPQARLILAPHEPNPAHLATLQTKLSEKQIKFAFYSTALNEDWTVLLIDRVGILAELYTWGQLAFVGGSFRKTVHSVMEPLAAGCLTLVGPYHTNNREALAFSHLAVTRDLTMVQAVMDPEQLVKKWESARQLEAEDSQRIRQAIRERAHVSAQLIHELEARHWLS